MCTAACVVHNTIISIILCNLPINDKNDINDSVTKVRVCYLIQSTQTQNLGLEQTLFVYLVTEFSDINFALLGNQRYLIELAVNSVFRAGRLFFERRSSAVADGKVTEK